MDGKPWLKHYDEGVPPTLQPYPERTLLDVLRDAAQQRPDLPALLFKGARVSYRQLEAQSDAFAAALAGLGVRKGDRVSLLLPNCPQFIVAELGAWKAGAVVVPLNPIYTERELEHPLASCEVETIVTLTPFYARVKALQPRTRLRRVIATNIKEYLPPVLRLLFTLAKEKKEGHRVTLESGDLWLGGLLRHYAGFPRPAVPVAPDDPALILFSGGTTGIPKGAIGLHRHLVATGLQLRTWLGTTFAEGRDSLMLPLPLFHSYGGVGAFPLTLVGRYPLSLIPNPRDVKDLLHTIAKVRPAILCGVPTLFTALLNDPDVQAGKLDLRSIRVCVSSAAPLMAETKRRFEEVTGGRITEGYSLTEAMIAAVFNPLLGLQKLGSVGVPLPDVEVRIVDVEDGERPLPPGEVGEIIMHAPQLMAEYWKSPVETERTLRVHDGAVWLHTGDLGYLDGDGFLFLVERKKDLIKVSGYQVWPREIEEVIATHPAVAEVAVAGVPDARKSEVARAWVVLRQGTSATEEELRAFCREQLAPYKVPDRIEFRETLPKTMVGKILRRALVEELAKRQDK